MVNIKEMPLQAIEFNAPKQFKVENILGSSSIKLSGVSPKNPTEYYLFIEMVYTVEPVLNEFTMNCSIVLPFCLIPINQISITDLFTCVTKTIDKVQQIVNVIYGSQKNKPIVAPIEFDDVSQELDRLLREIF